VTNYYVYYRVDPERVETLRPQVQELFTAMQECCGVSGRWMRRRDDSSTWMEVYEGVQDEAAFEAVLERESAKLGLERKTERFRVVSTCA
jgi:quinol monooxygenase YgiN